MDLDVTLDWFWEGNVVSALAKHLTALGWVVEGMADTHSKARGVDLSARKGATQLLVEVKGYPSAVYRDPRRAGESKPTNPTNQAQQWFSHAILKAMRLQTKNPAAIVGLGFPDFPRYRTLFEETRIGLARLEIAVFFIRLDGTVQVEGCVAFESGVNGRANR